MENGSLNSQPFASVVLGPGESRVIKAPVPGSGVNGGMTGKHSYGAIRLVHDGPDGSLNTSGWIENDGTGYSTMMTFWDPGRHKGTKLFGTQVFLGRLEAVLNNGRVLTVHSYLDLLNTSEAPLFPEGELAYKSNNGQIVHMPLTIGSLGPHQTAEVDFGQLNIPPDVGIGAIEISYTGVEGALMGRVFGIGSDPTFGFYSALETYAPVATNEVYWTTAGDMSSLLTVTNFSNHADSAHIVLTYNGGSLSLPAVTLQPLESTTVNVRDLRTAASLPTTAVYGGFRIFGSSGHSSLLVKEHVIDGMMGIATPFYGGSPYAIGTEMDPWSQTIDLGSNGNLHQLIDMSDGSQLIDIGGTISSEDSSIVTVGAQSNMWPFWFPLTAQGLGVVNLDAQSTYWPTDPFGQNYQLFYAQAQATVAQCFAQLKYRPVTIAGIPLGNHSFWWIQPTQNTSATQWVTDAGPSGICPLNCGYLVDWVVKGSTGNYPEDNPGASLAWNSGVSAAVCPAVMNLYNYAVNWPQTTYQYALGAAPNSNTFAHWAGNAAPFSPTPPPNAPGW